MSKLYVMLTSSAPDYNANEPRYVMSGFVALEDLEAAYSGDNYSITDTLPEGAVFYQPQTRAQRLESFFNSTVLNQKNNAPTALQIAVMMNRPTINALVEAELYTAAKAMVDALDVGEDEALQGLKVQAKAIIDGE